MQKRDSLTAALPGHGRDHDRTGHQDPELARPSPPKLPRHLDTVELRFEGSRSGQFTRRQSQWHVVHTDTDQPGAEEGTPALTPQECESAERHTGNRADIELSTDDAPTSRATCCPIHVNS